MESGEWAGPRCERVVCPQPDVVYRGLYSCSHGFFYGSNCTLKCPAQTGVNKYKKYVTVSVGRTSVSPI